MGHRAIYSWDTAHLWGAEPTRPHSWLQAWIIKEAPDLKPIRFVMIVSRKKSSCIRNGYLSTTKASNFQSTASYCDVFVSFCSLPYFCNWKCSIAVTYPPFSSKRLKDWSFWVTNFDIYWDLHTQSAIFHRLYRRILFNI